MGPVADGDTAVTAETPQPEVPTEVPGAFYVSLRRNNRKIRNDRAVAIAEDAEMAYKRRKEDIEMELKRLRRDRENMLDLSPTDSLSLTLASDFKAHDYAEKDINLGVQIRNLEITLDIADRQYERLFGGNGMG